MKRTKIYSLSFPEGNVRYIGKSDEPEQRLKQHIYEARRNKWNSHKNNWIRQLLEEGNKPIIEILEEVDCEKWEDSEKYWISQFKAWNFDLVNKMPGGQGIKFYTDEIRKKLSNARLGLKLSYETKNKMSEASFGKSKSDEHSKNIGKTKIGNKYMLGKNHSEETKKSMNELKKGIPKTDEHKKKLREAKLGIKDSEQTRLKKSESATKAWNKRKSIKLNTHD